MVAVMSAIETLLAVAVAKSGDQALRNIANYSELREQAEFYLS